MGWFLVTERLALMPRPERWQSTPRKMVKTARLASSKTRDGHPTRGIKASDYL